MRRGVLKNSPDNSSLEEAEKKSHTPMEIVSKKEDGNAHNR